jgi:alanyl-tRNA synthetase
MLTKADLLKPENFALEFFRENDFSRYQCKKCKNWFWSKVEKDVCGDASCVSYEFIGNPTIPGKLTWRKIREKYINFFKSKGHTQLNRYPVVARWKPDTLFTGASIFNFMPWVLNQSTRPPFNPLVVDQPSIRFVDVDNVGLGTGRHCTQFSMMAHHCFNSPEEIYWKEKTVALSYEFFTKVLKMNPDKITYIENLWKGGGNAGPCFEVMSGGNEIATLVFMQYEEIDGKYVPMKMSVVDTGYGLERIAWASQGTPTIYDSIYPKIISFLKKQARVKQYDKKIFEEYCKLSSVMNVEDVDVEKQKKILVKQISKNLNISEEGILEQIYPYHNIYKIADHTKALCFLLGDGIVPSNIQEGYLARLLIRRSINALRNLGIDISLEEIVEKQINEIKDIYPEIENNKKDILKMIESEEKKHLENIKNAKPIVKRIESLVASTGKKTFDKKSFVMLYESHGLDPEIVKEHLVMPSENVSTIDIRKEIRNNLEKEEQQKKKLGDYKKEDPLAFLYGLKPTQKLYYEDEKLFKTKATILKIFDNLVVLDKTLFYPRGGGAEPDSGSIEGAKVLDVENHGDIIIHTLDSTKGLEENQLIEIEVDSDVRDSITRHHTATHIVNAVCRKVLGNHVWQGGTKKDKDKAHLNITHYETPSSQQITKIEKVANEIVKKKLKVIKTSMDRTDAEQKYGFKIYQGGAVPGSKLRIVNIDGWDVEACGGLHKDNTSEIGKIIIRKIEKPHDGVIRFVFSAGKSADLWEAHRKQILKDCAEILKTTNAKVPEGAKKLFEKWKQLRKKLEKHKQKQAEKTAKEIKSEKVGTVDLIVKEVPNASPAQLQQISQKLSTDNTFIVLLGTGEKVNVFCSAGKNVNINSGLIASKICQDLGGKGGGSPVLAQGFGTDKKKIPGMIKKIKTELIV